MHFIICTGVLCIKFLLLFYSSAQYNNIERIDSDAFEDLNWLQSIYLDYNNITTIESKSFKGLTTVRKKTLAVKNFGEFGELLAIRQSFFRQFSEVDLVSCHVN